MSAAALERIARAHYRRRRHLAQTTAVHARRWWLQLDRDNLDRSWSLISPRLLAVVTAAQLQAAAQSTAYTEAALAAQHGAGDQLGAVVPSALAGIASDGRPLDSLLREALIDAKTRIGAGGTVPQAMQGGLAHLLRDVSTQVQDAGRVADGVSVVAHRKATGYVRMLTPPSCSRCVVLAGKRYGWNAGFQRHPHCDCVHIPATESLREPLTDPREYFDALSPAEQARAFTAAGAQAIRDGADVAQVVNARRGAAGLSTAGRLQRRRVHGQDVFTTSEGMTRRGFAGRRTGPLAGGKTPRLMPESIYALAENRDDAIRLLRRYGYLT